jgi:hypothetical protein
VVKVLGFRLKAPRISESRPSELDMKVTIRVEITTDWNERDTFEICQLERPYRGPEAANVGTSMTTGPGSLLPMSRRKAGPLLTTGRDIALESRFRPQQPSLRSIMC